MRMYCRFIDQREWKQEVISDVPFASSTNKASLSVEAVLLKPILRQRGGHYSVNQYVHSLWRLLRFIPRLFPSHCSLVANLGKDGGSRPLKLLCQVEVYERVSLYHCARASHDILGWCLRLAFSQMGIQLLSLLAFMLFMGAGQAARAPSRIIVNQPSVTPLAYVHSILGDHRHDTD